MRALIFLLMLIACSPLTNPIDSNNTSSISLTNDAVFDASIKTVQLYPNRNDITNVLLPPSVSVQEQNLRLEFDDLREAYQTYSIKITHCNADWSKSSLANLDFLTEYNSFPINQYAFSSDTHTTYVHYWTTLPRVKLSGNYVVTVYRDDTVPVFSKRFMIYDKLVQMALVQESIGAAQLSNKQGVGLRLQYPNLEVLNPATQFEVQIRQNQRWDNVITNLPPTFFRDQEKEIEYRALDEAYMHDGGNEYRFIDLRTIINTGQNIATINKSSKPYTAIVGLDQSREKDRYSQYLDFNGNYVIMNYDNTLQYAENYVKTVFTYKSTQQLEGDLHLEGKLIENEFSNESLMIYDSARNEYRKELFLKQGWYNYQYVLKAADDTKVFLEGNHFATENSYEVLVYYKSVQPRADLLVGYIQFTKNPR